MVAARHLRRCARVPTVQAVRNGPSRQPESLTNHGTRATTSVVIASHIARPIGRILARWCLPGILLVETA